MTPCTLARADLKIPMPDRGNRLFGAAGETVDETEPYYRRLIEDGDIIAVPDASRAASKAWPSGAPAGRRKAGGTRSRP